MGKSRAAVAGVLVAIIVAAGMPAGAAPGDPDTSWGTSGKRYFTAQPSLWYPLNKLAGFSQVVTTSTGASAVVWDERDSLIPDTNPAIAFLPANGVGGTTVRLTSDSKYEGLGVDGAGRFLLASVAKTGGLTRVRRFSTAGVADSTFGTAGLLTLPASTSVIRFLPGGSFVSYTFTTSTVRLHDATGAVTWTEDLTPTNLGSVSDAGVDAAGRIYLVGSHQGFDKTALVQRLAASDGTVDPAYGPFMAAEAGAPFMGPCRLAVINTGSTWIACQAMGFDTVKVQRHMSAGTLDTGFTGDGSFIAPSDQIGDVSLDPTTGNLLLVTGDFGSKIDAGLRRFTATGPDTALSGDGLVTDNTDGIIGFDDIAPLPDGGALVTAAVFGPPAQIRVQKRSGLYKAPPGVPGTPVIGAVTATSVALSWTAPPAGAAPLSSYRVSVFAGTSPTPTTQILTGTTATNRVVTGLQAGTPYRFKVAGSSTDGTGGDSAYSTFAVPPFASVDAFTTKQFADFALRAPSAAELTEWRNAIVGGTSTPVARVDTASRISTWGGVVDPVTRLFYAFFKRPPDTSGLTYWTGQLRSGQPLSTAANSFAASSEFKNTYGSLTNRAFVKLVYQNVLGRPGDTAGENYWTGQLDSGKQTRGKVMTGFSESNEHKNRRAGEVSAVNLYMGLLRRVPTSGELTTWAPLSKTSRTALIQFLLGTAAYDARV